MQKRRSQPVPQLGLKRLTALAVAMVVLCNGMLAGWLDVWVAAESQSTATIGSGLTNETPVPVQVIPDVPISGQSAVVLEQNRQRVLYGQDSDRLIDVPAASKLMTALIACEQLKLETMITISSIVAETADRAVEFGQIPLGSGEKYSFEFLLLRMLFYDSDAAALALAEQISGEESEFVKLMNSKAKSLELVKTGFATSTGLPVATDKPGVDADTGVTTPLELARLASFASQNSLLQAELGKRSEYLVIAGLTVVSMHHQLESIWTLSDSRVTGAFFSDRTGAATITYGNADGIPIITVVTGGSAERAIDDSLLLYTAIEQAYEVATLVEAGDYFFGGEEQTIDGETFGLVYLKSVTYVRPVGQDYLESTVQYQSFGPFSRPILSGAVVGQAIFKLLDGTMIAVDVGPDRQILSSVTLFDRALKQLQSNPNLSLILLSSLAILILVLVVKLILMLIRLSQLTRLLFFEIRSRR